MELIIGGAYHGKLTWTVNKYGLSQESLCDLSKGDSCEAKRCRCCYHLEQLTREYTLCGKSTEQIIEKLDELITEDTVVVAREIGCGIVPMDASERLWREQHGQVLSYLARRADKVYRIFYGLAEVLK